MRTIRLLRSQLPNCGRSDRVDEHSDTSKQVTYLQSVHMTYLESVPFLGVHLRYLHAAFIPCSLYSLYYDFYIQISTLEDKSFGRHIFLKSVYCCLRYRDRWWWSVGNKTVLFNYIKYVVRRYKQILFIYTPYIVWSRVNLICIDWVKSQ